MQKNFLKNINKGFTMIETLVAISIFTISVISLTSVLYSGVKNINYAKKKIVAIYLAQEGLEEVRNLRDTYVLYEEGGSPTSGWVDFETKVSACDSGSGNVCYVNTDTLNYGSTDRPITAAEIYSCTSGVCPSLLFDESSGRYNYFSGVDTDYVRETSIEYINTDEMKVVVRVSWMQGSGSHEVSFSENLFNWTK